MAQDAKPGNGSDTLGDTETVEETPTPTRDPKYFPPTLVGMDPPTLPAADGLASSHRETDHRDPADLPQFSPFPEPQRSVPGHPGLRRALKRVFLFWRKDV